MDFLKKALTDYSNCFTLNPNVILKDTDYEGGLGVYLKCESNAICSIDNGVNIELMRISKRISISLKQLQQHTQDLDFFKNALNLAMSDEEFDFMNSYLNEKNLLVLYLCLFFSALANLGMAQILGSSENAKDSNKIQRFLKFVDVYMNEVLMKTTVNTPLMYNDSDLEKFKQISVFQKNAVEQEQRYTSAIYFFITEQLQLPVEYNDIIQIYSGITSRILQIPEEIDSDSNDFHVNETLVPMLDFVNHDNNRKNAYFDLDRNNGDIILLLDTECLTNKEVNDKEFEIFISYDPEEEVSQFDFTYGFIPNLLTQEQTMKICLDFNLFPPVFRNICKWFNVSPFLNMKILPNNEVVVVDDSCFLNFTIMLGSHDYKFVLDPDFEQEVNKLADAGGYETPGNFVKYLLDTVENENSDIYYDRPVNVPQVRYLFEVQNEKRVIIGSIESIVDFLSVTKENKLKWINEIFVPYCVARISALKAIQDIPLALKEIEFLSKFQQTFDASTIESTKALHSSLDKQAYLRKLETQDVRGMIFWNWFQQNGETFDLHK